MNIHEYTIKVSKNDIDDLNHVNNVRYVDWINDAAKNHWQITAPKNFLENNYWVVLSHYIEYKSAAFLDETILVKTYVRKSEGVKSYRIVELYNKDTSKLLVKAETIWCMIDAKTHRPFRIPEEIINLYN